MIWIKAQSLLFKGSYFLGTREQCNINTCTKNLSQKRFANGLISEEKEVYLAEPMEDFELPEDYFYIIEALLLYRNSPHAVQEILLPIMIKREAHTVTGVSFPAQ